MSTFDNDILQPITDKELHQYVDILKKNLPKNSRAHHFILMQIKWKKYFQTHSDYTFSVRGKYNFFKPQNGYQNNCTFVAITIEGNPDNIDDYTIFIFSDEENNTELRQCIFQTKRINWKLGPWFLSIESQHLPIIKDFMVEHKLESDLEKFNLYLWLPKEEAKVIQYDIPDDIYIAPLKIEHTEQVDSAWYKKSIGTKDYVFLQLSINWGIGIFKKNTNELVSWVINCEHFCPGILTTLEKEQGNGYGLLITKAFCKEFAERENIDLISFVVDVNYPSLNIFKKLNFRTIGGGTWLKITRSSDF